MQAVVQSERMFRTDDRPSFELLDLEEVRTRMILKTGWNPSRVDQAIAEYRDFLALCRREPGKNHHPSEYADNVWHTHLLYTQKYAEDCQRFFGFMFHHVPSKADCGDGGNCGGSGNGSHHPGSPVEPTIPDTLFGV